MSDDEKRTDAADSADDAQGMTSGTQHPDDVAEAAETRAESSPTEDQKAEMRAMCGSHSVMRAKTGPSSGSCRASP